MNAYMATGVTLNSDIYVGANCFFGMAHKSLVASVWDMAA